MPPFPLIINYGSCLGDFLQPLCLCFCIILTDNAVQSHANTWRRADSDKLFLHSCNRPVLTNPSLGHWGSLWLWKNGIRKKRCCLLHRVPNKKCVSVSVFLLFVLFVGGHFASSFSGWIITHEPTDPKVCFYIRLCTSNSIFLRVVVTNSPQQLIKVRDLNGCHGNVTHYEHYLTWSQLKAQQTLFLLSTISTSSLNYIFSEQDGFEVVTWCVGWCVKNNQSPKNCFYKCKSMLPKFSR